MFNFINQTGIATALIDFTQDFSPLLVGLLGVVGLATGMIAWEALRYYIAEQRRTQTERASAAPDQQDAA